MCSFFNLQDLKTYWERFKGWVFHSDAAAGPVGSVPVSTWHGDKRPKRCPANKLFVFANDWEVQGELKTGQIRGKNDKQDAFMEASVV